MHSPIGVDKFAGRALSVGLPSNCRGSERVDLLRSLTQIYIRSRHVELDRQVISKGLAHEPLRVILSGLSRLLAKLDVLGVAAL